VRQEEALERSTIVQITEVTHGPKQKAERPVPVGWEQLPVTEGSFRDERIKMNPPVTPSKGSASRSASRTFFSWYTPNTRHGMATIHHTRHHCPGKNPSMMCIPIRNIFFVLSKYYLCFIRVLTLVRTQAFVTTLHSRIL